jgi:hypothetical protein
MAVCEIERPPLVAIAAGRRVACHLMPAAPPRATGSLAPAAS